MGLREKVGLVLVSIVIAQVTISSCMPSTRKGSLLKQFDTFKTPKTALNPKLTPTKGIKSNKYKLPIKNACNKKNESPKKPMLGVYQFPETEYPLDASPKNPFYLGSMLNSESLGSQNTQSQAFNDFKKQMRMKRKLNKIIGCQSSQSEIRQETNPKFSAWSETTWLPNNEPFPETQYPTNVMEIWEPYYWNPSRFIEKEQTYDCPQCPIINPKSFKPCKRQMTSKAKQYMDAIEKFKEKRRNMNLSKTITDTQTTNADDLMTNDPNPKTTSLVPDDTMPVKPDTSILPASNDMDSLTQSVNELDNNDNENNQNEVQTEQTQEINDASVPSTSTIDEASQDISNQNGTEGTVNNSDDDTTSLPAQTDTTPTESEPLKVPIPLSSTTEGAAPRSEAINNEKQSNTNRAPSIIVVPVGNSVSKIQLPETTTDTQIIVLVPTRNNDPPTKSAVSSSETSCTTGAFDASGTQPAPIGYIYEIPSSNFTDIEVLLPDYELLPDNSMCHVTPVGSSPSPAESLPNVTPSSPTDDSATKDSSTQNISPSTQPLDNSDNTNTPTDETPPATSPSDPLNGVLISQPEDILDNASPTTPDILPVTPETLPTNASPVDGDNSIPTDKPNEEAQPSYDTPASQPPTSDTDMPQPPVGENSGNKFPSDVPDDVTNKILPGTPLQNAPIEDLTSPTDTVAQNTPDIAGVNPSMLPGQPDSLPVSPVTDVLPDSPLPDTLISNILPSSDSPVPDTLVSNILPSPDSPQPDTPVSNILPTPNSPVPDTPVSNILPSPDSPVPDTPVSNVLPSPVSPLPDTSISNILPSPDSPLPDTPVSNVLPSPVSPLPDTPVSNVLPAPVSPLPDTPVSNILPSSDSPVPDTPVSNVLPSPDSPLLDTPVSNVLPSPVSPLPDTPVSNILPSSDSPVPDTPVSNVLPSPVSPLPDTPVSNILPSSDSPVPDTPVSNILPSRDSPLPDTPVSNVLPSPVSPLPDTPVSNVLPSPVSPLPDTPISNSLPSPGSVVPNSPLPSLTGLPLNAVPIGLGPELPIDDLSLLGDTTLLNGPVSKITKNDLQAAISDLLHEDEIFHIITETSIPKPLDNVNAGEVDTILSGNIPKTDSHIQILEHKKNLDPPYVDITKTDVLPKEQELYVWPANESIEEISRNSTNNDTIPTNLNDRTESALFSDSESASLPLNEPDNKYTGIEEHIVKENTEESNNRDQVEGEKLPHNSLNECISPATDKNASSPHTSPLSKIIQEAPTAIMKGKPHLSIGRDLSSAELTNLIKYIYASL